jgi:hypothetical protein
MVGSSSTPTPERPRSSKAGPAILLGAGDVDRPGSDGGYQQVGIDREGCDVIAVPLVIAAVPDP